MHARKGKEKWKNFLILLNILFSVTIVMKRIIPKLKTKEDYLVQWHTQAGNNITNIKVKIYCILSELRSTRIMT